MRVLPISEKFNDVAEEAVQALLNIGVRVSCDRNADKVGAKIRLARLDRVPYMLVIGAREAESGSVSVRHRDRDDLGAVPINEFVSTIQQEIATRSL